jgi:DNA-binding transcriptional regulator YiaG
MSTASLDFPPERVKAIRVRLGLTQEDFAQKLGVDGNIVSRWETGKTEPTRGPILKALLDAEAEASGA